MRTRAGLAAAEAPGGARGAGGGSVLKRPAGHMR
jgi:hypothetical protein